MMNDLQFEFLGFKPDEEVKDFVWFIGDKLHWNAPSDSTTKIAVRKTKKAIEVSCRIVSQAGTFVADAMSDSPFKALQQVEKTIRNQLETWGRVRFKDSNFSFDQ